MGQAASQGGAWRRWLAAVALAMAAAPAVAAVDCSPTATAGVERCVAGIAPSAMAEMYQSQQASQWCWAASVAMVLRRYGLRIPQEEVARQQGGVDDAPASARAIAALLDRAWTDDAGRGATASSETLPPWRRAQGFAAPEVLADLAEGRPLLLGAQRHAMVLVQVVYERRSDGHPLTPQGVRVLRAAVLDPASGAWLRSLRPAEAEPDFLARVRVDVQPAPVQQLARAQEPAQR